MEPNRKELAKNDMKLIKISGKLSSMWPEQKYDKMRDRIMNYIESELKNINNKNKTK